MGRPPPDPRLLEAFVRHPCPPLIDEEHRLGVIWSQKSASAVLALWFFAVTGRIDAMLAQDPWPHDHRIRLFHEGGGFEPYVRFIGRPDVRWIRVVRDPYRRAVSMYRHVLSYGNLDDTI